MDLSMAVICCQQTCSGQILVTQTVGFRIETESLFVSKAVSRRKLTICIGRAPSSTLCVTFAFLALFAVNCFKGFLTAKYAKIRKGAKRNSRNQDTTNYVAGLA